MVNWIFLDVNLSVYLLLIVVAGTYHVILDSQLAEDDEDDERTLFSK